MSLRGQRAVTADNEQPGRLRPRRRKLGESLEDDPEVLAISNPTESEEEGAVADRVARAHRVRGGFVERTGEPWSDALVDRGDPIGRDPEHRSDLRGDRVARRDHVRAFAQVVAHRPLEQHPLGAGVPLRVRHRQQVMDRHDDRRP